MADYICSYAPNDTYCHNSFHFYCSVIQMICKCFIKDCKIYRREQDILKIFCMNSGFLSLRKHFFLISFISLNLLEKLNPFLFIAGIME